MVENGIVVDSMREGFVLVIGNVVAMVIKTVVNVVALVVVMVTDDYVISHVPHYICVHRN